MGALKMLKVKDLKKILEMLDDEVDIVWEARDMQIYDCYAELKYFYSERLPCLVIAME
jgi:hypothetical protein